MGFVGGILFRGMGTVVERFVAIVDYLCYVAEIYENNGRAALATIDPKPYKIIENELIVPIRTRCTTFVDCFTNRRSFGTTGGAPLFIDALPH